MSSLLFTYRVVCLLLDATCICGAVATVHLGITDSHFGVILTGLSTRSSAECHKLASAPTKTPRRSEERHVRFAVPDSPDERYDF